MTNNYDDDRDDYGLRAADDDADHDRLMMRMMTATTMMRMRMLMMIDLILGMIMMIVANDYGTIVFVLYTLLPLSGKPGRLT